MSSSKSQIFLIKLRNLLINWQVITLIFLCVVILISHFFYVAKTNQFPEMDEQHYMYMATGFYRILQNPGIDSPIKIITYFPMRQPGYSLSILPFLLIFGISNSYKIALFINVFFYISSIIGIYLIGRNFFNKTSSFLASLIFSFYGWTLFYLHFTYSETATTTFVVWSLYFLIKSDYFRNRKNSFLFGLTFATGLLIRWVSPIFIIGPLIYVLSYSLLLKKRKIKTLVINLLLALLPSVPIIVIYILNRNTLNNYLNTQLFYSSLWDYVPLTRRSFFSIQSVVYYFKVFEQLNIFYFLLLLTGLIITFTKRRNYFILLLAFIVPFIAFSFGTVIKDDRYIVPLYPVIALISLSTIDIIKKNFYRRLLIFLILAVSIFDFFGSVWGIGPVGKEGLKSIVLPYPIRPRMIHLTPVVWSPSENFSNAWLIYESIEKDAKENKINPQVIKLFNYHPVDNALYAINIFHRIQPIVLDNLFEVNANDKKLTTNQVRNIFTNYNYILVKTNVMYSKIESNIKVEKAVNDVLNIPEFNLLTYYKKVKIIDVPLDHSQIIIYAKKEKLPEEKINSFINKVLEEL